MALYYNFSGGQQYELADSRQEMEAELKPVALRLGVTDFVPGQEVEFGYFTRPLLYVGAEVSEMGGSYSMYFYTGNTADKKKQADLFDAGKAVYMVIHWITPTCFLTMGARGSGRDFKYIRNTWDWERGPGTKLGGRHEWQGQAE